jgi:ribosomal protein L23
LPHTIEKPAELSPANRSAIRTRPVHVTARQERFPPHPKASTNVLTDPRLWDTTSETPVRMPLANEKEFDRLRVMGFFPGDPKITRTHYLGYLQAWQARVRGEKYRLVRGTLQVPQRIAFLCQYCFDKGLPVDNVSRTARAARPLELGEFYVHSTDRGRLGIKATEMNREKFKEVLKIDPLEDGMEVTIDAASLLSYTPSGSGEAFAANPLLVRQHVSQLFDWERIANRLRSQKVSLNLSPVKKVVVGYQVFLPNIVVRLLRNSISHGEPYDPWVATFQIPMGMTKTDLRSYLKAVYNLDVTFIRTFLSFGKIVRDKRGRKIRQKGTKYNYKKAVVGLHTPFHYPDDPQELRAVGRATGRGDTLYDDRMNLMEDAFNLEAFKKTRAVMIQKIYKRASAMYRAEGKSAGRVSVQLARLRVALSGANGLGRGGAKLAGEEAGPRGEGFAGGRAIPSLGPTVGQWPAQPRQEATQELSQGLEGGSQGLDNEFRQGPGIKTRSRTRSRSPLSAEYESLRQGLGAFTALLHMHLCHRRHRRSSRSHCAGVRCCTIVCPRSTRSPCHVMTVLLVCLGCRLSIDGFASRPKGLDVEH